MMLSAAFCFSAAHMRSSVFCFILSLIHQYRISKALESLDHMLDMSMPCAVLLLVSKGVTFVGCRCPSSMQAMSIGQQCLAPRYMPPISAFEAEAMTILMVWQRTLITPFCLLLFIHPR